MAPTRGPQAQSPGQANGFQRDHPGSDPGSCQPSTGTRHAPGGGAGNPAGCRPVVWLSRIGGLVEEGWSRSKIGRTCSIGSRSPRGGPRARAHGFHAGGVLGHRRAVSSRPVPGAVGDSRWGEGRNGVGLRRRRATVPRGGRTSGRGVSPGPDVGARWTGLHGRLGDAEAFVPKAEGTVHDLDASAGSLRPPSVGCPTDHADRTVPLRERLHHLHANRLHHAV